MSKNSKFAVVGAGHPGAWPIDKHAAVAVCELAAPTGLHYKIARGFLKARIHCLESTRLAAFGLCATAVSVVPDVMSHDSDMIPEATTKRCLSLPIFAQLFARISETEIRPLSAAALHAT
jgi:hypothetical protein